MNCHSLGHASDPQKDTIATFIKKTKLVCTNEPHSSRSASLGGPVFVKTYDCAFNVSTTRGMLCTKSMLYSHEEVTFEKVSNVIACYNCTSAPRAYPQHVSGSSGVSETLSGLIVSSFGMVQRGNARTAAFAGLKRTIISVFNNFQAYFSAFRTESPRIWRLTLRLSPPIGNTVSQTQN